MKNNEKKNVFSFLPIILAVVGLIAGYCYYRFIGCASGTCGIASNPFLSTILGGLLGFFIGNIFIPAPEGESENDRPRGG